MHMQSSVLQNTSSYGIKVVLEGTDLFLKSSVEKNRLFIERKGV